MLLAPVVLFTYKRLDTLKKTVESLQKNDLASESELYIFSDAARSEKDREAVDSVRKYITTINGFKKVTIFKSEVNNGLANSIINGVTKIINKFGKAIILEDDLKVSSNFLVFMNSGLAFYMDDPKVFSISGYSLKVKIPKNYPYDTYFTSRGLSWGWATWSDRWNIVDWDVKDYALFKNNELQIQSFNNSGSDLFNMLKKQIAGKIDSWAIRWYFHQFKESLLTVYPILSKVENVGFDARATHTNAFNRYTCIPDEKRSLEFKFAPDPIIDPLIFSSFKQYYSIPTRIIYGRIVSPIFKLKQYILSKISPK